jgi:hypothetical protein
MSRPSFHDSIRTLILLERTETARALNACLVTLFWDIGKALLEQEKRCGMGERDRLARYLSEFYPGSILFSRRNLGHMRKFVLACPDRKWARQRYGHLPWTTILRYLEADRLTRKALLHRMGPT